MLSSYSASLRRRDPEDINLEADADDFVADLFVDRDYDSIHYAFGNVEVQLAALTGASTAYDLTGQIVWTASRALAAALASDPSLVAGRVVLEVGAGAGLAGLVAAGLGAAETVLTDGHPTVVELLEQNTAANSALAGSSRLWAGLLEWSAPTAEFLARLPAGSSTKYDVILGADVVHWPAAIGPLWDQIDALLAWESNSNAAVFLAYTSRSTWNDKALAAAVEAHGFEASPVPLPAGSQWQSATTAPLTLWRYSKKPGPAGA